MVYKVVKKYLVREYVFFFITLILCISVLYHFILPFVLGVTFAYLLEPIVYKAIAFFHIQKSVWKWTISFLLVLITLMFIFGPILTLITTAIQELISVLSSLQNKAQGQDLVLLSAQKASALFEHFGVNFSIDDLVTKFTGFLKSTSRSLLDDLGHALYATPEFILKFFIFLFTLCFFLVKGKELRERFLTKLIPWEKERKLVARTCASVLKAVIVSNVLVAVVQAFLITLVLVLFGVPRYILFGMIAFFISFIPIIGTTPLILGASAWCYLSEGRLLAAIGILVCGILIYVVDTVLRPYFMKGGAELQFFWIFLAIICGMSVFGIPGAVIGPVSFALFAAALRTLELSKEE